MYEIVLTRRRVLVGVLVAALVVLVGSRFLLHGPSASTALERPIVGSAEAGSVPASGPAASPRLVVYVVGAVRRPGLYRVAAGSRVADAVERAGGLARRADPAGVNLAAPVADGEQLVVPARLPVAVAAAQGAPVDGAGGSASTGPVQLSVATAEQLDSLPGIGPVTTELSLSPTATRATVPSPQATLYRLSQPVVPCVCAASTSSPPVTGFVVSSHLTVPTDGGWSSLPARDQRLGGQS